jgi:hypothetical protein
MPDDLNERDILAWSEHQADLLRRLGHGERVNDVDWTDLAEEIEDVGRSQPNSVETLVSLIVTHILKLHCWPESEACGHWRGEIVGFQFEANMRFTASMRRKIDIEALYGYGVRRLRRETPGISVPVTNPFALDDLLTEDDDALLSRLPPPA